MKGLVGDVGSLKKKRSLTPDVLKVSESFQILFVTATLICLNKISPGRKIDTINSDLFFWKQILEFLQCPVSPYKIMFFARDRASGWMLRVRVILCLKLVILNTCSAHQFSILFLSSGDAYSHGAASPISTPNIAKRKSVNDRSVSPDISFFSPSINNFRKLRPKSVVDNGEGYTSGPGIVDYITTTI